MHTINGLVVTDGVPQWQRRNVDALVEGQVRVRIHASGVNRADLMQIMGHYPAPSGYSDILGLECAGVIEEVSVGVEGWEVGDRVCVLLAAGGYADQVVCDARQLFSLPDEWNFLQGAGFIEAFATAWLNIFQLGQLMPGEKVLIYAGASGVGSAAIQLCKVMGNSVTAVVGSEKKRDFCLALGAEEAVIRDELCWQNLAVNAPFNLILDCVAGDWLQKGISLLAMDGRLLLIGLMGGGRSELDVTQILMKRIRLQGSTLRSRSVAFKGELLTDMREHLRGYLKEGKLCPIIDRVFPAAEMAAAFAYLAENQNLGKVVIEHR